MVQKRALIALAALAAASAGCTQSPFAEDTPRRPADPDEPNRPDDSEEPFPGSDGGLFPMAKPPERLDGLLVAETTPPPISGGTLAVSSDGTFAVAADPDRDAVYVVALPDGGSTTVELPEGSEPGRAVLDASGYAHVALRSADAVVRIALADPTQVVQTSVCQHPRGLAYDASADALWVACANGELVSLAAKTHAELTRTFVALDLRDVVITSSGERFVSRYRSAELLQIAADGSVAQTTAPARMPSLTGFGEPVHMSPTLAWRTAGTGDGKMVMLHQVAQEEAVTIQPGGYGGGGGGCGSITRAAVTVYDEHGEPGFVTLVAGAALSVDVAMSPDGRMIALATPGAYLRNESGTLQVQTLGLVEVAPDGGVPDAGFASDAGVPSQPLVDAGLDEPVFQDGGVSPVDAGFGKPFDAGICFPNGFSSTEGWDEQVTAVAFDAKGLLYTFSREPARLTVYEAPMDEALPMVPVEDFRSVSLLQKQTVELGGRSVRDTGHELFHADVGSGLACASCHGEALDDGHVWTFVGFGPRRTQNMRGGVLSTLPLHWEGDMPTFQHLVDDVMTGRMGGFRVEPRYADALASWIDAQPELKLAGADADAIIRGKVLFESNEVACATCHSGELLTNNESADVGTGGLFQVPSLLGLGLRAPFMHDGCAETLTERFEPNCGGGDAHGKTSQLSAAEVADLVAYLETL